MCSTEIKVHPLTQNPSFAWERLRVKQKVIKLNVKPPSNGPSDSVLRFVCMSDTHSLTSHLQFDIPDGDVFVHAGDFTRCGSLQHKYKVIVAGNHELSFDTRFIKLPRYQKSHHKAAHIGGNLIDEIPDLGMSREELKAAVNYSDAQKLLTNGTYLQDESLTICGVKLYGTPWQPEFCNWAFNLPRGEQCLEKWRAIPNDTDVLITHTPPIGHGDFCCTGVRAGDVELLETVQKRIKPKYHIFGHIHEGYGITTDGKTIFINASTCNQDFKPVNSPFVFDVQIPSGHLKC